MNDKQIYLDHGASTPVHPQVVEAMLPYWTEFYGNPSSKHKYGRSASRGLEKARRTVAEHMHAQPKEIVFTGCGSESDNLAVRGVMWAAREQGNGNHLITSCIEHEAVINTAVQLRDHFGFDLTILPVDKNGQISLDELQKAIRPDTALISIMAANNEIGTMQPIQKIGKMAREHDVLFHTDAVQAAVSTRWNMTEMPIDLISLAPHKFYGPKGVGILYVRDGVNLISALTGGGQEEGRRAGTVNVPFAVGGAEAFRLAQVEMDERVNHYVTLRDRLIKGVLTAVPDAILTGHPTDRLPHNASFAFRNVSGNDLIMHLDMVGIAGSSGSACNTGNPKPSETLQAIGLSDEWTTGGLRLTVGTQNSLEDIEHVIQILPGVIQKLQKLNTLLT
ncbi:MAG: cysteine desulfurase [Chloroflexi bacterium]|nr:MAG: cysteine desulfurase [Chloroflexota bacterium]